MTEPDALNALNTFVSVFDFYSFPELIELEDIPWATLHKVNLLGLVKVLVDLVVV